MILEVEAINTFYGKSHILQDISFNVDSGEVVALLGRNGVGKTTTLRSIMGLTPPQNGVIRFKGEQTSGNPAYVMAKKGIAYMPDDLRIFPDLTCEENLEIARRLSGRSGYWNRERVEALFPVLSERPRQMGLNLSGGEKK
ncbi:MAG: ATP-binding cassette domain-containing protein, partial [Desulfobacterales bacterium]